MGFSFARNIKLFYNFGRLALIKHKKMGEESQNDRFFIDIGGMRVDYRLKEEAFTENDLVAKEPMAQFKNWFDEACVTPGILEANAMCLSTCNSEGFPTSRYVLLKGYSTEGFKFFTNYSSRKGRDLEENPRAALVFYWEPLKRSVRVEGIAEKLSKEECDDYFHSRPIKSQIGACVSEQSKPIQSRNILTEREAELKRLYEGEEVVIPRPELWGGFLVRPVSVEFWQGQSDRLHDRIRFRRPAENEYADNILLHEGESGWLYERLSP